MKYLSFLRGINVGGHKIIKMTELAKLFSSLGLKNVRTFIQSGNVAFESSESAEKINDKIKTHLSKSLGYDVDVMTRTWAELTEIVRHNPFSKIKTDETKKVYISFLSEEPDAKLIQNLLSEKNDTVSFKVRKTEVYVLYHKDKAKHPFSNNFLEKKLKVKATTRAITMLEKLAKAP